MQVTDPWFFCLVPEEDIPSAVSHLTEYRYFQKNEIS